MVGVDKDSTCANCGFSAVDLARWPLYHLPQRQLAGVKKKKKKKAV
jgi:hypothetical protein